MSGRFWTYLAVADAAGTVAVDGLDPDAVREAELAAEELGLPWPPCWIAVQEFAHVHHEEVR